MRAELNAVVFMVCIFMDGRMVEWRCCSASSAFLVYIT